MSNRFYFWVGTVLVAFNIPICANHLSRGDSIGLACSGFGILCGLILTTITLIEGQ